MLSVVGYLEPFLIYPNDLTFMQYIEINKFIREQISQYNRNLVENGRKMAILKNIPTSKKYSSILLDILDPNKEIKHIVSEKYDFIELYGQYLIGRSDDVINTGMKLLERDARSNNIWFIKLNAVNKINQIIDMYAVREKELQGKADKQSQYQSTLLQKEKIQNLLSDIKKAETNENLIKIYKN
jgi:hypothetical protein